MNAITPSQTTFPTPPAYLKKSLSERSGELSMLPSVAQEAIALTNDPECTAQEFSQVIERDMILAAEILSQSNSFLYSRGRPVATLEQAIVRLGFRQCRNLIISSSMSCLFKKLPLADEWIRGVLWQHSFMTATTCAYLNRGLDLGFQGEEFTAGMLHDFGRLLIAIADSRKFAEVDTLDFCETASQLDIEQAALGTDHCQFGAWFAHSSGLPESLVDVVRWHHHVDPPSEHRKLIALTIAGDHLASYLQRELSVEDYVPQENPGIAALCKITGNRVAKRFEAILPTVVEEVLCNCDNAMN